MMKDKITWVIMGAIMLISIIFALTYFTSLKDVADYNAVTRQLTTIYDKNSRLNTLFLSHQPNRNFGEINTNMELIYNTLDSLKQNKLIINNGFLTDIDALREAFKDKITLIDELSALNSQNDVIIKSMEQKYIGQYTRYEIINIYSQIAQLDYKNFTEIYALQKKLESITPISIGEKEFMKNANQIVENFTRLNKMSENNNSIINAKFQSIREKFANFNENFYGSFIQMTMIFTVIFLTFLLITYMVNSDSIRQKRRLISYKTLVDNGGNAVLLLSDDFKILYANHEAIKTFGYSLDELNGADIGILRDAQKHECYIDALKIDTKTNGFFSKDVVLLAKNGEQIDESIRVLKLSGDNKRLLYGFFAKDMRENAIMKVALQNAKDNLKKQVYIDHLTGFGNEAALNNIINSNIQGYVIYIAIANFAGVRLFYKTEITNEIIKNFTSSLSLVIDGNNIKASIFRMQDDEFCVFYEDVNLSQDVEKIRLHFKDKTIKLNSEQGFASTAIKLSIGVSSKQDIIGGSNRLFQAIIAMNEARMKSEDVKYYQKDNIIEAKYLQNQIMINTIQNAIEKNRIFVLVQPIFDITNRDLSGKIYGTKGSNCIPLVYEILIRLVDQSGKTRSPGEFLEIAKKASLYVSLTKVVISEAFRLIDRFAGIKFSINLSFYDIANDEIRELLENGLAKTENANNLFIEILESEEFDDYENLRNFIAIARNYGCTIAIDDFGSGYSNYYRILTLDVDFIKIDGALIKDITTDHNARAIVETIVMFAHKQNYKIIAEYVENHEISNMLENMGIKYMQGFWYSTPMEPSKISL